MTIWDDKAFAEGISAYRYGLGLKTHNPYDEETENAQYKAWREGWIKASNDK